MLNRFMSKACDVVMIICLIGFPATFVLWLVYHNTPSERIALTRCAWFFLGVGCLLLLRALYESICENMTQ